MMPSSKAKQNWNAIHYTQVKVSVNPDIAAAFKVACTTHGRSQAGVLSQLMAEYSQQNVEKKETLNKLDTRKRRRTAVTAIAARLEDVLTAEEHYYDNVPENLHGSKWHEASESSISVIQEAIELMTNIYE